jgi:hypothetical protein
MRLLSCIHIMFFSHLIGVLCTLPFVIHSDLVPLHVSVNATGGLFEEVTMLPGECRQLTTLLYVCLLHTSTLLVCSLYCTNMILAVRS